MTATQPLIFKSDEVVELISSESKQIYLNELDRITFINRTCETLDLDEFKSILREDITEHPQEDFLIVLNTINSSIDIFKDLQEFVQDQRITEVELYYLSTNIIPKHRLQRIQAIKESSQRKIIVSTQLVEAGVDIDVDRVYRDFGPLDSLNQIAGRCNRNFNPDKRGVVITFSLRDGKEFYQYIYGKDDLSISKTRDVLRDKIELSEKKFLELGSEYFRLLKDSASDERSENILDWLSKLMFYTACEDAENKEKFGLIESQYPTCDLFIEIDESARKIWQRYSMARELKDPFERKQEINRIKKDFYNYVISVPARDAPGREVAEGQIKYINNEQLLTVYDEQTGFIRIQPGQFIF